MKTARAPITIPVRMITLGMDSSEAYGGAALVDDGQLIAEAFMEQPLRHSEELLPLVGQLLTAHDIERTAIGRVAVNRGPGSFTGLRIGIATAKGFAHALGLPVAGVDGTRVYRERVPAARRVCVIIKNRRDLFYVQWFTGADPHGDIRVISRDELLAELGQLTREVTVVGSGVDEIDCDWREFPYVTVAASAVNRPSPEWVARLGQSGPDELYGLDPVYVEPALGKQRF